MADPSEPSTRMDLPSAGAICGACKRPDMTNMTWEDGVKHFFSTFHATPRMWPVGYILDNPYSPLRLERELPDHNWRDAFEDLLALEARGAMIRKESRMAEDRFAARNRFEYISGKISIFNILQSDVQELESMWQEAYQKALRDKNDQRIEVLGKKLIPSIRSDQQHRVASIQQDRAEYERNRHSTASSLKPYGQWIASLMDSGALPSWKWSVIISVDGPVMSFGKRDAPPELDAGITCSEFELEEQFQQGQPHDFGTPTLLTRMHVKPLIDKRDSITEKDAANDPFRKFRPSKSSILAQTTDTETIELPDGSVGSKVLLENYLADGTSVVKEFVQEPEKLLEEIAKVYGNDDIGVLGYVRKWFTNGEGITGDDGSRESGVVETAGSLVLSLMASVSALRHFPLAYLDQ